MVCLILRYMASGESFRCLGFQFCIARKIIRRIIIDLCKTILEILGSDFLKTGKKSRKIEIGKWPWSH